VRRLRGGWGWADAGVALVALLLGSLAQPLLGQLPEGIPGGVALDSAGVAGGDAAPEAAPPSIRSLDQGPRGPSGFEAGVWSWDAEALLATRALTLLELLEEVPGVLSFRAGDHGQPTFATAFGLEGGRVRVYVDGIELPPLDGGLVDLSRVGFAGVGGVRVERGMTELRIDLLPIELSDSRPYTQLEIGTGDLNTNIFRGTFAHPMALGGTLTVTLDRVDTEGPFRGEAGATFGGHVRHTLFQGDRGGVAWEFRSRSSRRPEGLWAPAQVNRSELTLLSSHAPTEGFLLGGFLRRSTLSAGRGETGEARPGALGEGNRVQGGLRGSWVREEWWARSSLEFSGGEGWRSSAQRLSGGGGFPGLGWGTVTLEREGWEGGDALYGSGRLWSAPLFGLTLFGELSAGKRGVPRRIPPRGEEEVCGEGELPGGESCAEREEPLPLSLTDRTGLRVGARWMLAGAQLGAALLQIEADSLHPTGLPFDREGELLPGGTRRGAELEVQLPLHRLWEGVSLEGSLQLWEEGNAWRYLPDRSYHARVRYHRIFFESGNLEVWADAGVTGRDPMRLPLSSPSGLAEAPFRQSWFGRLQLRVVSVRVFLDWENITLRERNQDLPGRILPATRLLYGVRWTLWN